jgi:hypothetical protein
MMVMMMMMMMMMMMQVVVIPLARLRAIKQNQPPPIAQGRAAVAPPSCNALRRSPALAEGALSNRLKLHRCRVS